MSKKLKLFALVFLLLGQVLLGPMGSAFAESGDGQGLATHEGGVEDLGTIDDTMPNEGLDRTDDSGLTGSEAGTGNVGPTNDEDKTGNTKPTDGEDGVGKGDNSEPTNNEGNLEPTDDEDEQIFGVLGGGAVPFGSSPGQGQNKFDLKIQKIDRNGNNVHTSNGTRVKFKLTRIDVQPNQVMMRNGNADSNNIEIYTNLLPGTYKIEEIQAPTGYVLSSEVITVLLSPNNSNYNEKNNNKNKLIKFKNDKNVRDVELTKTDADTGEPLNGVKFNLQKKNGNTYEDVSGKTGLTTQNGGKISITNLPLGDYRFVETQALQDYDPTTSDLTFSITDTQIETVKITATNKKKPAAHKGKIYVQKTDNKSYNSTKLSGAYFQLYDSNKDPIGDPIGPTDSNGRIVFEGLADGTYYVKESQAPENYSLNEGYFRVVITNGVAKDQSANKIINNKPLVIKNTKLPNDGKIKITKMSENNTKLNGVTFELYKKNSAGHFVTTGQTVTTSGNGTATFSNLYYGEYMLKEIGTNATYPVVWTDDEDFVKVNKDATTAWQVAINNSTTKNVTITNYKKTVEKGTLKIYKKGQNPEKPNEWIYLSNVEFKLSQDGQYFDVNGNKIDETDPSGIKTNEDGWIIVTNLQPGTYKLTEVSGAPSIYQELVDPIPVTIVAGQIKTEKVYNFLKQPDPTGTLIINKTFEGLEEVGGFTATFTLTNEDGAEFTETTNGNGVATFSNLVVGETYTLHEVSTTSANHERHSDYITGVSVTIGPDLTDLTITKNIENPLKTGTLIVTKVDSKQVLKLLPGAEFELLDANGKQVGGKTFTTGPLGTITFTDLPYGTYTLVELNAPGGYEVGEYGEEGQKIEINSKVDLITVKNVKKKGGVTLVKHAENDESLKGINGAKFDLYKKECIGVGKFCVDVYVPIKWNLETGINGPEGKIELLDLGHGDYYFKETKAPANFEIIGDGKTYFTIDDNEKETDTLVINIANKPTTGKVTLTKYETFTVFGDPTQADFEGVATFDLFKKAESEDEEDIKIGTYEVSEDNGGKIEVDSLTPGDYYFVEQNAPGYIVDSTPIEFTIKAGDEIEEVAYNEWAQGEVTLMKTDDNANPEERIALGKAHFILEKFDPSANEGEGAYVAYGNPGIGYFITGDDGKIHVENLPSGEYQFRELTPPPGYKYFGNNNAQTAYEFTISKAEIVDGDFSVGPTASVEVKNTKNPGGNPWTPPGTTDPDPDPDPDPEDPTGSIALTKVDSDNGTVLSGAEFTIYQIVDGVETVFGVLTTNGFGQLEAVDLPIGSYYIVETKAPVGYVLDDEPFRMDFTITEEGEQASSIDIGTVPNKRDEGVLGDGDEKDPEEEPKDPDEGVIGDGEEKEDPKGEKPGDKETPTEVNKPTDKGVLGDSGKKAGNKLPQTGEEGFMYMVILGYMLLAAGGLLLFRRKRKVS